ncbi:DUF72 domain-containing protein [Parafrigoribacterium soli]|uniref:DUF72 domain-containing protein n=1 Tax=Parafrigoribacterium soli TaxID=3144663 RepID=UPI0032EB64A7
MAGRQPRAHIGISGWRYAPWRGVFYPTGLAQRRELEYVAERLGSVELNGSFYSLQRPESYRRWHDQTPEDFVFAVKGPRFITHMLRLRGAQTALANFFASGVLALGPKMGPVLWQLPERHAFDAEQLDEFLTLLPRTLGDAARLATSHDARLDGRAFVDLEPGLRERPIRYALEVRSPSFGDSAEFPALLRAHGVALVAADAAGRWPMLREDTADFRYLRLHGDTELYASGYGEESLDSWAAAIRGWAAAGQDSYVYFDNDAKVHAPFDALSLQERLSGLA